METEVKHGHKANQRGSAAVEFALVAGLVFLLLFAFLELVQVAETQFILDEVARSGARLASVDGGGSQAVMVFIASQLEGGGLETARTTVSIVPHQAAYGSNIRVRLDYRYPVHEPLVAAIAGANLLLHSQLSVRSERLGSP